MSPTLRSHHEAGAPRVPPSAWEHSRLLQGPGHPRDVPASLHPQAARPAGSLFRTKGSQRRSAPVTWGPLRGKGSLSPGKSEGAARRRQRPVSEGQKAGRSARRLSPATPADPFRRREGITQRTGGRELEASPREGTEAPRGPTRREFGSRWPAEPSGRERRAQPEGRTTPLRRTESGVVRRGVAVPRAPGALESENVNTAGTGSRERSDGRLSGPVGASAGPAGGEAVPGLGAPDPARPACGNRRRAGPAPPPSGIRGP